MTIRAIQWQRDAGGWSEPFPGSYYVYSGPVPRRARIYAAVLHCGEGAVASHETAAELLDLPARRSDWIHVTIPHDRHVRSRRGLQVHRSVRVRTDTRSRGSPPHTDVEATVCDLVEQAKASREVLALVAASCQRRLTTPARLRDAVLDRPKIRWRARLLPVLEDIASGAHSLLELDYLHKVERAHGLPPGRRQHRVVRGRRTEFHDVYYEDFDLVAELDGRLGHSDFDDRHRDMWRDNRNGDDGTSVLRFGLADVDDRPCLVARQVVRRLKRAGWQGTPRRCGPRCEL